MSSREDVREIAGEWRGEYIDVYGHRADVRLNIEGDEAIAGSFQLSFRTEDAAQRVGGEFRGRVDGGRLRIEVPLASADDAKTSSESTITYDAQLREAGSYARVALFGVASEVPETNFGGGVWIAWRFEKS